MQCPEPRVVSSILVGGRPDVVKDTTTSAFDLAAHAFWRIRHDATSNNIMFETAPNNSGLPGGWTARRTIPRSPGDRPARRVEGGIVRNAVGVAWHGAVRRCESSKVAELPRACAFCRARAVSWAQTLMDRTRR